MSVTSSKRLPAIPGGGKDHEIVSTFADDGSLHARGIDWWIDRDPMAVINGTSGDDNLTDTNDTDTLNGFGGNDTITVTFNQDIANGGTGSDRLIVGYSAATNPVIVSIGGADAEGYFGTITESAARGANFTGIDHFTITTGSGNNNITTGSGDDVVTTGGGVDTVTTGSGNDTITTGAGDDIVSAGDGNDVVDVGAGNDTADGGDGVDGISASVGGTSQFSGGAVNWNLQTNNYSGPSDSFTNFEYFKGISITGGTNVLVTTAAALTDVITSTTSGGTTVTVLNGKDFVHFWGPNLLDRLIVDYSAATSAVTMSIFQNISISSSGIEGWAREGNGSTRGVDFTGLRHLDITTGSGSDSVLGANSDDTFRTNGGNDTVDGADGSDTFRLSGNRANYLVTQNADSSLTIVDTRAGSPDGTDTVRNVESFAFADGTVTLAGLLANPPAIDLNGAAFGTDNAANYSQGSPPAILAPAAVVTDADSANLGGGTVRISSGFQSGVDLLTIGGATSGSSNGIAFSYNGSTGVLTLSGAASIGTYEALLHQVAFSATSITSAERPTISWALNDGTVTGATANTTVVVSANAAINGTPGDDNLVDTNDADTLNGFGGNDTITVTFNQDVANGGTGSDRLIVGYSAATNPVIMSIGGADAEGYFGTVTESAARGVNFTGIDHFTITGGSANNNITTGSGDDIVTTGGGADTVTTGSGNDTITTGAGNDIVSAGDGNDVVDVGAGNDTADGGDGVDGISASVAGNVNWNLQTNSYSGPGGSFTNFEYFKGIRITDGTNVLVTTAAALGDFISSDTKGSTTITVLNGRDTVHFQGNNLLDRLIVDYSAATGAVTMSIFYNIHGLTSSGVSGWAREGDGSSRGVDFDGLRKLEITTGSGNDSVLGANRDDMFRTNGGNDTVDGADGSDTFGLSGNRANYLVTQNADSSLTIVDTRAGSPDGTDTVRNVESFAFADGTVTLSGLLANPPAIDLNGAAFGTDNSANYSQGGSPAILAPAAVVTDADSVNLGGATVRISSGFHSGELLTIGGATSGSSNGIAFSYSGSTGVLTLSGAAPIGDYQALLREVAFSASSIAPTERPTISWTLNDGTVTGATANTTLVVLANDPPVARDDAFSTDEASAVGGNLFSDNGSGADSDPESDAFSVTAVNGSGSVGSQISLPSGALLTVNANGTFSYDPNGAFNATPAPGSGASNQPATDSFTYTISRGDTATVTIAIAGLDSDDVLIGTSGNDTLDGGIGADQMFGLGGNDWFFVRNSADQVYEEAGGGTADRAFVDADWVLGGGSQVEIISTTNSAATIGYSITGNAFAQTIYANNGNNIIDGGGGGDAMIGFGGDDWFFVRNSADQVYEEAGGGTADRVFVDADWVLGGGSQVEIISTTNSDVTVGYSITGNELAQTIYANNGNNIIDGGGGGDVMIGFGGDDWFFVRNSGDQVYEEAGGGTADRVFVEADWVLGGGSQVEIISTTNSASTIGYSITGNALAQTIYANNGNNIIDGGGGGDVMIGFGGDDWFFVRNSADQVYEEAGGGTADRVFVEADWILGGGSQVEIISTTNSASTIGYSITGNELSQTIYANDGNNIIDGGGGGDVMIGFGGDDWFFVRNAADQVYEEAGGGAADRVFAAVNWTLNGGSHIETMSTANHVGTEAIDLTGNEFAQTIYGNEGANRLDGAGGNDTLRGGGGADTFAFASGYSSDNVDTILDFEVNIDKIGVTGLTQQQLDNGAFHIGSQAADADDRIIYDSATGALYFDSDGSGAHAAIQFASLTPGLSLTAHDFTVI